MTEKLTIVVHARPCFDEEGNDTNEFVYHATFKEECGISHWHSRGETVKARVVDRAREVANEAGYDTHEEVELVEV